MKQIKLSDELKILHILGDMPPSSKVTFQIDISNENTRLTQFMPMFLSVSSENIKTRGFLIFSWGMKRECIYLCSYFICHRSWKYTNIFTSLLKAVMIKYNYIVVTYNILLHILTSMLLDLRWLEWPKKAPKGAYFH